MLKISKANLNKSINNFIGIIEGISLDSKILPKEIGFLNAWLDEHQEVLHRHPFNELAPAVQSLINNNSISEEERLNILWLCEKLTSSDFYTQLTATMQRLHGLLAGIASDGLITEHELKGLRAWLDEHDYLTTIWPFDEVSSIITNVMSDGVISPDEHEFMMSFFLEFVNLSDDVTLTSPTVDGQNLFGICATCPEIEFADKSFCFTGESAKFKRHELQKFVNDRGGRVCGSVSKKVDYLVVGVNGNPSWSYACYGRKIEQAIHLRRQGFPVMIIHEYDFHDAIQG